VQTIHFIRRAQELGFSLNEIRELLILQSDNHRLFSRPRPIKNEARFRSRKNSRTPEAENQLAADLKKCERTLRRGKSAKHDCCPVLNEIAEAGTLRAGKR
jgi:MerR family copper efflux transcriptional regulator